MKIKGGNQKRTGCFFLCLLTAGLISFGCGKSPRGISVCALQGPDYSSPFVNQEVIISGLVTADFEDTSPAGFFIQDEECDSKNGSSRGIYILSDSEFDRVSIGDEVIVQGLVEEHHFETRVVVGPDSVQILSVANPIPKPVEISASYLDEANSFNYETWEGMLVHLQVTRVVDPVDSLGHYWIVPGLGGRIEIKPGFDNFIRGMIKIIQNQPDNQLFSTAVGDTVHNLIGVLRHNQDGYFLQLIKPAQLLSGSSPSAVQDIEQLTPEDQSELENIPTSTLIPTETSTPYPIPLLLTEFLPDPSGEEPDGEWVEIYNPGGYGIPLSGIKIGDEISPTGKEGMLQFPDGYFINANQVLVIAHKATIFRSTYGFYPDFEFVDSYLNVPELLPYPGWGGSMIQFSNSGDEVLLLDPWDQVLDLVSYGNSSVSGFHPAVPAPKEGFTLERYPPDKDRDNAEDWRERAGGSPGKLDQKPPTPVITLTPTLEPYGTPTPVPTLTSTPGIPSKTPAPVRLLLSEMVADPAGAEPDGEWIEIYNPGLEYMQLTGVKIGDAAHPGDPEGMLVFPDEEMIDSRGLILIAQRAVPFEEEYGFKPDFEISDSDPDVKNMIPYHAWSSGLVRFSNVGDELILLNGWDEIVDSLAYGESKYESFQPPVPAAPEGSSLARYPIGFDTDTPEDWIISEIPSPGKINPAPPTSTPGITPSLTLTPTLDMTRTTTPTVVCTITLSPPSLTPTSTPMFTITSSFTVQPSPTLTPGPTISLTPTTISTPTTIPTFTATPSLNPQTPTASSTYTPSPTLDFSLTPSPSQTPDLPSATPTQEYVEDVEIVLNEIHADPHPLLGDANGDGMVHSDDDEFLELINLTAAALDISGWEIRDGVKTRYIFPPGTLLKGHCGLILFGGGTPDGPFGGSQVHVTGSLGLNNSGDSISLWDQIGFLRLRYFYGAEGGLDQSLTRYPDLTGNLPLVLHGELPAAAGKLHSPGVQVDGGVFGVCP